MAEGNRPSVVVLASTADAAIRAVLAVAGHQLAPLAEASDKFDVRVHTAPPSSFPRFASSSAHRFMSAIA